MGQVLDMAKNLELNGIEDETEELLALAMQPDDYTPAIHLYYNDDLTVAWTAAIKEQKRKFKTFACQQKLF